MSRFTINRLMFVICVVAAGLAIVRTAGLYGLVATLILISTARLVWLAVRSWPRLAEWAFAISTILANSSAAIVCAYLYGFGGLILISMIWCVTFPIVVGCGFAWVLARPHAKFKVNVLASVAVVILSCLPLLTMMTSWPLHLAFFLSKPSLERLADRVAAGRALTSPEWAGVYRVAAARRASDGNIALIIDANPGGNAGFVRIQNPSDTVGPMTNLFIDEPLSAKWRYQEED